MSRAGEKRVRHGVMLTLTRSVWPQKTGQICVAWEVSGGWLEIKHNVSIPEDKIAIIFYIPEKNQSEWNQYISTYKEGRLMNLISKYPHSLAKSYIMIGRNYQVGDGEIIDLIHDVFPKNFEFKKI